MVATRKPAAMAGASHVAISKKNMGELLLTKPELEVAVTALQALQGAAFETPLRRGCYNAPRHPLAVSLSLVASMQTTAGRSLSATC